MPRSDMNSLEKPPKRCQISSGKSYKQEYFCDGDEAYGNSEHLTRFISSPGVSSEADYAGGFTGALGNASDDKELVRNSCEEKPHQSTNKAKQLIPPEGMFQQLARKFFGADSCLSWASVQPDPGPLAELEDRERTEKILANLRVLTAHSELFLVSGMDGSSQQTAGVIAATKRAGVERIGEERSAAERTLAERLQRHEFVAARLTSERLEGERFSMERVAVAAENERMMADRLQRVEAREALYEQQVAAEQSRVMSLRSELEVARRELESREKGVKLTDELKAREVHIVARTQCLESMHEDARREIESLRLQRRIAEVDLDRSRAELEKANARQKLLEEELRLLRERPPKVPSKPRSSKKIGVSNLVDRHDLANRSAFEIRSSSKGPVESVAKPTTLVRRASEKNEASWSLIGCCSSPSSEGVRKERLSAKVPE